jgi:hypothetical protein
LTIHWPDAGTVRKIPKLAKRLHLSIVRSGSPTPLQEQDVQKPATGETESVVTFKDLPTDAGLVLRCEARGGLSNTDDTLLGVANETVTIRPGVPSVAVLDLVSVIDKVEVQLNGAVAGADFHMFRNEAATVVVSAKDADGALVPVAPGSLTIDTTGTAISLINESITLLSAGDALGTGTLVASEEESGKTTTINVFVDKRPGVQSVEISPTGPIQLIRGQSVTVSAKAFDEDHIQVPGATFAFTLQDPVGVTIAGSTVTGTAGGGFATLVATETTSSKQATTPVNVLAHGPAVRLAILAPDSTEIADDGFPVEPGTSYQLTGATFDQFENRADAPTAPTWSVVQDGGGTSFSITPAGLLSVKSNAIFGSGVVTLTATVATETGPVVMTRQVPIVISF